MQINFTPVLYPKVIVFVELFNEKTQCLFRLKLRRWHVGLE